MTNRLAVYWSEDTAESFSVALFDETSFDEPAQIEPRATLSFAEWAPRIRAERAANACPCRKLNLPCSVCRERRAQ